MIWAVRRPVDDTTASDQAAGAASLIKQLDEQQRKIMFPAIAVAEYLQGTPESQQQEEYAVLSKRFLLSPFDKLSSKIAAQLCHRKNWAKLQQDLPRQQFKNDVAIVATALRYNAECIYTNNFDDFQRIASGRIMILRVPLPTLC